MKPIDLYLTLNDNLRRLPIPGLRVKLWEYPTYLEDGTVKGIASVSSVGAELVVENLKDNKFVFNNVIPGLYTAVVYGDNIVTQIPESFKRIDTGISSRTNGSDMVWKEGEILSIAEKIEAIEIGTINADNIGDGTNGIFYYQEENNIIFRNLLPGNNISFSGDSTSLTINAVGGSDSTVNDRLFSIESIDGTQNSRLTNIESIDGTQNTRLTNIESIDGTQNTRLEVLESNPGGEINTASNLGSGVGVFSEKIGVDLRFKSFKASNDSTVSYDATCITISTINPSNVKYVSPSFSGLGSPYFTTPALAVASAVSGDLIIVFPGTYNGSGAPCITLKDGVNWYLHKGVTLTNTSGTGIHTVTDAGASVNCTIDGEGDIVRSTAGTGDAFSITGSSTNVTLYANSISSTLGRALNLAPYSAGSFYVKIKSASSTHGSSSCTVAIVGNGTLDAGTITGNGVGNSVVLFSAGTVYYRVRETSSTTAGIRGIYLDNTGAFHILGGRIKTTSGNPIRKDGGLLYLYNTPVLICGAVDSITAGSAQNVAYYGFVVGSTAVNANITNVITGASMLVDADAA